MAIHSCSADAQHILGCLQFEETSARLERLRHYSAADWECALEEARRYNQQTLLAGSVLPMAGQLILPAKLNAILQQTRLQAVGRNMRLLNTGGKIAAQLNRAGIPVIALKGVYLTEHVYEDISIRTMSDIDLLVRREQIAPAYKILEGMGFEGHKKLHLKKEMRVHHHLPTMLHPGGDVVELHWSIAHPSLPLHVDIDGLWQRALPTSLNGQPVLALCPEDLLLHLCLHLFQDRFNSALKRLYDIGLATTLYRDTMDWEAFIARAQAWGCHGAVAICFASLASLFGLAIPPSVSTAFPAIHQPSHIQRIVEKRLLEAPPQEPTLHKDLGIIWNEPNWGHKIAHIVGLMFPYPEYVQRRYHLKPGSWIVYPYYLVRLFDMTQKYARQMWNLLRGETQTQARVQEDDVIYNWWLSGK